MQIIISAAKWSDWKSVSSHQWPESALILALQHPWLRNVSFFQ